MTASTDFDRRLVSWLEQAGPPDVADEVLVAALLETESLGQRRAPWPAGPSRWPGTSTARSPWRLLAVAAMASLAIAVALVVAGGGRNASLVVVPPSPSASARPSGPPSPVVALPDEVRGTWLATQPGNLGFVTPSGPSTMRLGFGRDSLWISGDNLDPYRILESTAARPGPARVFEIVSGAPGEHDAVAVDAVQVPGCTAGDTGHYQWRIRRSDGAEIAAARGDLLELTLLDDACAARAAVLPRTWVRSLAAAGGGGMGVVPISAFTVRAILPPGSYDSVSVSSGTRTSADDSAVALGMWIDPRPLVDPCDPLGGTAEDGTDAATFLDQLVRNPAFTVEDTRSMSIGGRPATTAVLHIDRNLTCPSSNGGAARVPATQAYAWQTGTSVALPLTDPTTIYLISLPQHLLVVEIRAPDEQTRHAMLGGIGFADSLDSLAGTP